MKTTDSARDMDRIRASLGQKKLNFYGFSYGTYLGQVYATLFPERVRRMVFDSNVNPTRVWYNANLDQDVAFERNMKIWWGWVAKYDDVYHLGATEMAVEKAWYAEQKRLRTEPAGGKVGPDEFNDVFVNVGYSQSTWADLAQAWVDLVANHDPTTVIAWWEGGFTAGDDNWFATYNAVSCTDAQWPTKWSTWRKDNWRVYGEAPFLTWNNAWFNAPCRTWPAKSGNPVNVSGRKVPGILLVGETLDAATPFSGSLEVRKRFPKSSLIALPGGTTHANSLFGNECLDNQIADYLVSGKLPARKPGNRPDATCEPLPVPVPGAAAQLRSADNGSHALLDKLLHGRRL
jgi:pimeloyl-ACP methyl ester carboxylesterase